MDGTLGGQLCEVEARLNAAREAVRDSAQVLEAMRRRLSEADAGAAVSGGSMMAALANGMVRQEPVRILYRDEAGRETDRRIVPDGIFRTRHGDWRVAGWCLLRGEHRTFALRRVRCVGESGQEEVGWARGVALSGAAGPAAERAAREGYDVEEAVVRGILVAAEFRPDRVCAAGEAPVAEERRSPSAEAFRLRDRLLLVEPPAGVPWRVSRVVSVEGREAVRVLVGEPGRELAAVFFVAGEG